MLASREKLLTTATSFLVLVTECNKVLSHQGVWPRQPDISKSKNQCLLHKKVSSESVSCGGWLFSLQNSALKNYHSGSQPYGSSCDLPLREVFLCQLRGSRGVDIDKAAQSGSHVG